MKIINAWWHISYCKEKGGNKVTAAHPTESVIWEGPQETTAWLIATYTKSFYKINILWNKIHR